MRIGVPKEIKNHEYRVGMTPSAVRELTRSGHEVVVQTGAGEAIGFSDDDYRQAGASLESSPEAVFRNVDLIVKVKEPQSEERQLLTPDQTLFTYLHLAPDRDQTRELVASGATCIAYETVTDDHGHLPLLAPMSEVAGRMAAQAGAHCLERAMGGRGVLLGGVPGVSPARVTIIGAGMVGQNALAMAVGLGADVTILDVNMNVLRELDHRYGNRIRTVFSSADQLDQCVTEADLVIGAVLIPGASAPKLVTRDMFRRMPDGSVLVDVAIDQGGCAETSRPTTHDDPVFVEEGVVHYCVANMPGAVPITSAHALNNATLPFIRQLADKGPAQAMADNPHLLAGLNVCKGHVTFREVAQAHGLDYKEPAAALKAS